MPGGAQADEAPWAPSGAAVAAVLECCGAHFAPADATVVMDRARHAIRLPTIRLVLGVIAAAAAAQPARYASDDGQTLVVMCCRIALDPATLLARPAATTAIAALLACVADQHWLEQARSVALCGIIGAA